MDLGRDLAIKVLLEKHAGRPEVARRFIEEAQIGGQLQHPGVVPVYDIGRFGDRPFFTMKLVKGKTLSRLLGERDWVARPEHGCEGRGDLQHPEHALRIHAQGVPPDLPRFLDIAVKVAQTLAYAHAKGVIHRDLKPANIMVGAFGEVQVMDWGLAKVLAEGGVADEQASRERLRAEEGTLIRTVRSGSTGSGGSATQTGALLGTPAYMPPEQANGDVALLDRRADVFGLGAVLCEILTGAPPYVGRSSEEIRRKAANGDLADAYTRLDACGADVEVVRLSRACLAPEARDRPQDAQAVADALTAYLDGVQTRLRQAQLAEAAARAKAVEEAKRRRLALALAATVLLAVTAGGGGWLWVKGERNARTAELTREVNLALNRATVLRAQAKTASAGGAALFVQAREQAQRALAFADTGPVDAVLLTQVRQLQTELEEEERDRQFVAAIDAARLAQAETLSENRFAMERAVPLFRNAFTAYGMPARQGDPAALAARLRQRPDAVRRAALAALDEWADLAADPNLHMDEPHRDWLAALVEAVEPADGWTQQFRAAQAEQDPVRRRAALAKLADTADAAKLAAPAARALAARLWDAHDIDRAVRLLRPAQRQHPDDFWINDHLGRLLRLTQPPELQESVRYLTAAVALRPDSPGAHLNLGIALLDRRSVDEAVACFAKAKALSPRYAHAYTGMGMALKAKGEFDDAIAAFREAIALDGQAAFAYAGLGQTLVQRRQWSEGVACLRKYVELQPKSAAAQYELGVALAAKGDRDGAVACYRKAVALDGRHTAALSNLGVALAQAGQPDEAIACYRRAIAVNPKLGAAHFNLGITLTAKGQRDEAIASYRRAIAADPRDAGAHTNLGNLLERKGRLDEAVACHRNAVALDPKLAPAWVSLGVALSRQGQKAEAIACYRRAIAVAPDSASAHYNLGEAQTTAGELDAAAASLRRAIALNPRHVKAHSGLGIVLYRQGHLDAAIASYRMAITLDPNNAAAHFNLGGALKSKGQLDGAIACYRRAIALAPKLVLAHLMLGETLFATARFVEARAALDGALALLPPQDPRRAGISRRTDECARLAKLVTRLPRLLRREEQPSTAQEGLDAARLCQLKQLHAAVARFSAAAFAAAPKLADDLRRASLQRGV